MLTITGSDDADVLLVEVDVDYLFSNPDMFERMMFDIRHAVTSGIRIASEKIESKLISNLQKYGLSSFIDNVRVEYSAETITMSVSVLDPETGVDYAHYVEFGTGIVGSQSPHPSGGNYDKNNHGNKGWWYPTNNPRDGQPTWIDPEGTLRAWTRGMPSRPFFYDTIQWVKHYSIIKRSINAELKRYIK